MDTMGDIQDQPESRTMKLSGGFKKAQNIFWAMFLLSLPVTSFPYFPGFMGKDVLVRPLTLYPLLVLVVIVLIPRLFTQRIPRTLLPFAAFLVLAFTSTILALTQDINPPIDLSVAGRLLRTLATLLLGGMFYLTVSLVPQKPEDLRFTLTWLYAGFAVALLWASFQIVYVLKFNQNYFSFLNELQKLVSIRKLFDKRVSGMTYEPSWFAEQLTFVLMPWLFASVTERYSVFRWRYRWFTIELLLLGWSAIALLFTYSRGGLVLFIILLIISLILGLRRMVAPTANRRRNFLKVILLIGLVLLVFALVVVVAAQKNNYFARLWGYWTDEEAEGTYLYYIAFSQRLAYWETAYRIFEDHPVMGIGLGNFTFYFEEYLPYRQLRNPELLSKLVPDVGRNQVVTVKNFMIRLLAETGIVGTSMFVVFLVSLSGCVIFLLLSSQVEGRFWGKAGLLGLIAFLPVTLSIDSFAIPNMWVIFGLITASAHVFGQSDLRIAN